MLRKFPSLTSFNPNKRSPANFSKLTLIAYNLTGEKWRHLSHVTGVSQGILPQCTSQWHIILVTSFESCDWASDDTWSVTSLFVQPTVTTQFRTRLCMTQQSDFLEKSKQLYIREVQTEPQYRKWMAKLRFFLTKKTKFSVMIFSNFSL